MPWEDPPAHTFDFEMQPINTNNAVEAATRELAAHIGDADGFVKAARAALAQLRTLNEAECQRMSEQYAELESKIVEVSARHEKMSEKKRCKEREIVEYTSQLTELGSYIDSLRTDIGNLRSTIRQANEEIADNNRRQRNALHDVTPLHGIINAIISGDAKRAIPFYSQIDGIISAVENKKAEAEHRLWHANKKMDGVVQERNTTERLIDHGHEVLKNVQRELSECKATIESCERLRNDMSPRLTAAKNAHVQLKELATRYEFLDLTVNLVAAVPNKLVMQYCLADFERFACCKPLKIYIKKERERNLTRSFMRMIVLLPMKWV